MRIVRRGFYVDPIYRVWLHQLPLQLILLFGFGLNMAAAPSWAAIVWWPMAMGAVSFVRNVLFPLY